MRIQKDRIESSLAQITQNIGAMSQKLSELEQTSFDTERAAINASTVMYDFEGRAVKMRTTEDLLRDTVREYAEAALFDTKKGLDEKIQTTIKNTKLRLLDMQKRELASRKISWFGRLRGLEKLRDIELANIELEEQLLRNSGLKQKSEYSVQDSLADMRVFSIRELGGQNTAEMQAIIDSVGQVFRIHGDVIEDRARRKLNAVPMVISDHKKRVRTSQKIANAERKNGDLRAQIADTYSSYRANQDFGKYNNDNPLQRFYDLLDEAARSTRIEEPEKTQGLDKTNANVKRPTNSDFGVK